MPLRVADKSGSSSCCTQALQRGTDCRLRQTEPVGRARYAMILDQCLKDNEEVEIEFPDIHHSNILNYE